MRFAAEKYDHAAVADSISALRSRRVSRGISLARGAFLAACLALGLCCIALIFVHLGGIPRTWFDEGSHLHVPKTLVQTGRYADRSSEGFRAFGPTIGVGPTVMLPIAAVFMTGGITLLGARLVIALYTVLALIAFALLMNRLAGRWIALFATALLIAAPGLDFITTGRQVLGEVPAFAYILCGLHIWFARDRESGELVLTQCTRRCILVGGCFGAAIVTKSQLGIILAPSLLVIALLALRWERRIAPKQALVPLFVMLAVFAIWEIALLTIVTGGAFSENIALLRQASGGSLVVFAPHRMIAGARFLVGPSAYFALLLPALAYAVVRAFQRRIAVGELVLIIFMLIGFAWFVGGSVAWPRYAFVPLALAALPVAQLINGVLQSLRQTRPWGRVLVPVAATAIVMAIALSLVAQLRVTLATPDDAPARMAAYLNNNVPATAIIEAWEPELGFLTDHRYHYPPPSLLDRAVRHQWLGAPALDGYDPLAGGAAYLIVGPFARYTGLYDEAVIAARYQQVVTIGDYRLYRLASGVATNDGALRGRCDERA